MNIKTDIIGKYNSAIVYTDKIEQTAIDQIKQLCDQEFVKDTQIRIMSDVHAGKGCVIGFTMEIKDKIIPNLVGVDIGCGVICCNLGKINIDLPMLNYNIKKHIPSGKNINDNAIAIMPELTSMKCYKELKNTKNFERALGTLGGGNHFIEIDVSTLYGNTYIVIHTGSRNLGKQVADYYQNLAIELHRGKDKLLMEKEHIIKFYKENGKKSEIPNALKTLENKYKNLIQYIPEELCYLSGKYFDDYLFDMKICQKYASLNRHTIAKTILSFLNLNIEDLNDKIFETVHNYIDFSEVVPILRKGAISAKLKENVIIPMNMRDGSIIATGKGNADWNYSAPHGAGRLMSRNVARNTLDMSSYISTMANIYTTSVCKGTLDEAPDAYKPINEILERIIDTVEVVDIIKSIYNFKAIDE